MIRFIGIALILGVIGAVLDHWLIGASACTNCGGYNRNCESTSRCMDCE